MTEHDETTGTHFEFAIKAEHCDGGPAKIELAASVGEFQGLLLGVFGRDVEHVELTADGARRLRDAIDAALPFVQRAEAAVLDE